MVHDVRKGVLCMDGYEIRERGTRRGGAGSCGRALGRGWDVMYIYRGVCGMDRFVCVVVVQRLLVERK